MVRRDPPIKEMREAAVAHHEAVHPPCETTRWRRRARATWIPPATLIDDYRTAGLANLAARYGVAKETVRHALVEAGVTIRAQGDRSKPLDDAAILHAYEQGATLDALGVKHGVDHATIARRVELAGGTLRAGSRVPVDVDEIVRRYADGFSTETIAEVLEVSPQTVTRRLLDAGVKLRPRGAKPNGVPSPVRDSLPAREVVLRYEFGWSLEDLAAEYGVSHPTIKALLVREGVEMRKAGTRGGRGRADREGRLAS
jgi:DNA-directed RNA polymerase specialized sigma24 family protein